jgi:glutamate N-acetyltransferase/amino-acid N-acetyltransferase
MDYGDTPIVRQGRGAGTPEAEQTAAIDKDEFVITLDLGVGAESYTLWTCDLSYEYVKINAEYKT